MVVASSSSARKFLIPVPPSFGGAKPAPAPGTPEAPTVNVEFPEKKPSSLTLFDQALNDQAARVGAAFHWPTSSPLSLRTQNTLDAAVRISVHIGDDANTSLLLAEPVLQYDVGPGSTVQPVLSPDAGDAWGLYIWVVVQALATPTRGTVRVSAARRGA